MWKKVLVFVVLALICPVTECSKKKNKGPTNSKICQRTNSNVFRYCTRRSCSSDGECRNNEKCLCDGDCGMSCVKNKLRCKQPPKPRNSQQTLSDGLNFGSVVTYKCSGKYKLRGSASRTCRAIGKWDGRKARCRIICDDPGDIAFGNRRYDGFQAGKYITYWCYDAYEMVGTPRIRCKDNGKWSGPRPKCELPRCTPPPIPDDAEVIHPKRMPKTFKHSDIVLLNCKVGYFKIGIGALRCKKNDIWTGGIKCSPKSCGRPNPVSHGRIIGYVYSFKHKVRYSCNEGYELNGPAYRQCQANEKWSGRDPTCDAVDCGPLSKPADGDIIERVAFTYGNRIVFKCKSPGYEMKGSRIRTCQNDGSWSGSLTTCEIVKCGDPGNPANGRKIDIKKGFVYLGSVTFECNEKYTLEGAKTVFCRADKSWSTSLPRCLAPCPDPGVPYQGYRVDQDFRHDRTVRFTCPRDYVREGVAEITCADGRWNNNKPSCKAPCKKPGNPTNGWKSGQDFKHGHSVTFHCDRGYQRVGASSITCNDGDWDNNFPLCTGNCGRPRTSSRVKLHGDSYLDGDNVTFSCFTKNHDLFGKAKLHCVDQTWDFPVPECKGRCTFDGAPQKGNILNRNLIKGSTVQHNDIVEFVCDRSYTLTGSKVLRCDDGRWNASVPSCKASCGDPGYLDRGKRTGDDFSHGQIVTYQCARGYSLDGPQKRTCVDGTWDSVLPQCKASCDPLQAPRDGTVDNKSTKHGVLVSFSCNNGFTINGPGTVKCIDGKWNGSTPTCKGSCKNPGPLKNGKIIGNDFTYGSTVKFQCDDHYELTGSQFASCVKGQWSTDIPKCWKRCQNPVIPKNGWVVGNNFAHGGAVTIVCRFENRSFDLASKFKIKCNNGSWSRPLRTCEVPCNNPGKPSKGTKHGDDYRSGATVTFSCNKPFKLIGSPQIVCRDGNWSDSTPTCSQCGRPLGIKNNKIQDFRITSPTASHVSRLAKYARLNGPSSWCSVVQTYLQIDLGRTYQVTYIATQGGAMDSGNKWVKQYKVSFYAGATELMYYESGFQKTIQGNRDASSVVRYQLKEPFVTRKLRIYPVSVTKPFCLRIEVYGCDPNPECILPGSLFYGFWRKRDNSNNYFRAFITNVDHTHIDFALEFNNSLTRRYKKTDPVLIINKIPEMKEISVNAPVIAVHIHGRTEWYRTGKVAGISVNRSLVLVKFDNGDDRWVPLKELLLVRHPRFC